MIQLRLLFEKTSVTASALQQNPTLWGLDEPVRETLQRSDLLFGEDSTPIPVAVLGVANEAIADPWEECSAANSSLLQSLADAENRCAIDSDGHSSADLYRNAQSRSEPYGDGMIHERVLLSHQKIQHAMV